jgi:Protein of unknown function (DUF2550)
VGESQFAIDGSGLVVIAVVAPLLGLVLRRRWLGRGGGTFEASLRLRSGRASSRGWSLGVGRYSGERLEWFRVFSVSLRPKRVYSRGELGVVSRRTPRGTEAFALYSGHVVLSCRTDSGPIEIAMSDNASTGFLAWLEAAPPGRDRRP